MTGATVHGIRLRDASIIALIAMQETLQIDSQGMVKMGQIKSFLCLKKKYMTKIVKKLLPILLGLCLLFISTGSGNMKIKKEEISLSVV